MPPWVIVRLKADGEEIRAIVLTEKDDWEYTFKGLAGQWNGGDIHYSICADPMEGYIWEIRGATLIGRNADQTAELVKESTQPENGKPEPDETGFSGGLMKIWLSEDYRLLGSGGECFD